MPDTTNVLQKYVRDAINKAGHKVDELDNGQRARAVTAPQRKAGLRGKALAAYVMDGTSLTDQAKDAQVQRDLKTAEDKRTKRSDSAKAAKNQKPAPLSAADKEAARTASASKPPRPGMSPAAAKAATKPKATPVPRSAKYPDNIRAAVEAARKIGGRNWWPSPVDHVQVRVVVTKLLADQSQTPSRDNIKALVGCDEAALTGMANMTAGREELKALKDLNTHMDDASAKGRNLAAVLLVWMDELDGKLDDAIKAMSAPKPKADPKPPKADDPPKDPTPDQAAPDQAEERTPDADDDVAVPDPDDVTVPDEDTPPSQDA